MLTVVFPLVPVTQITVSGSVRCPKKSFEILRATSPGKKVAFLPSIFKRNLASFAVMSAIKNLIFFIFPHLSFIQQLPSGNTPTASFILSENSLYAFLEYFKSLKEIFVFNYKRRHKLQYIVISADSFNNKTSFEAFGNKGLCHIAVKL